MFIVVGQTTPYTLNRAILYIWIMRRLVKLGIGGIKGIVMGVGAGVGGNVSGRKSTRRLKKILTEGGIGIQMG